MEQSPSWEAKWFQLVKKFPKFYVTRRFITAFTSARHLSLSWASSILSINPHPTSWISILILSFHLRLGLPLGLLPSGFPTKPCKEKSPNTGRCIISYQEVLSSLLKNVNHQADGAGPCNHSINGQLLRTLVLTGRLFLVRCEIFAYR